MSGDSGSLAGLTQHLSLTNLGDLLQYLWVGILWWVRQLKQELAGLHSKQTELEKEVAVRPTMREVSSEVGEEIGKVEKHLERIESLLWKIHTKRGEEE